jgi:hypothetical protein
MWRRQNRPEVSLEKIVSSFAGPRLCQRRRGRDLPRAAALHGQFTARWALCGLRHTLGYGAGLLFALVLVNALIIGARKLQVANPLQAATTIAEMASSTRCMGKAWAVGVSGTATSRAVLGGQTG